jgi:hypothetical protein
MIELNFLESCDHAIIGTYKSLKDTISIGSSLKNDIIIKDRELFPIHFYIQISKDGLICWNAHEDGDYYSNDKLYKGRKIHLKNEKIRIGSSLFEIMEYSLEEKENPEELLKSSYEKTIEKYPQQEDVIDEIENEMGHLEDLINS